MVTTVVLPPRSERVSGSEIDTGASDDIFGRRLTTTCSGFGVQGSGFRV